MFTLIWTLHCSVNNHIINIWSKKYNDTQWKYKELTTDVHSKVVSEVRKLRKT